MATSTRNHSRLGRVDDDEEQHGQLVDCFCERLVDCDGERRGGVVVAREVMSKRPVSRLAVEGGGAAAAAGNDNNNAGRDVDQGGGRVVLRSSAKQEEGRTLPPPHAWLAIEDTKKQQCSDPEDCWLRLLRGGGGGSGRQHQHQQHRRSSFTVVRRERAAREAWLDRAWEMKRSWHERNGGAPDADTPVVVVVGNNSKEQSSSPASQHQMHVGAVGGGGVAMDVEEVRACRDLGLELPSDCTVEIQCYGIDGGSPTHTGTSSGADSPCGASPGAADPVDVKARLKAWAQAVALTSTTQLGS